MQSDRRRFLKTLGAGLVGVGLGEKGLLRADSPAEIQFWDMRTGPTAVYRKAAQGLVDEYNGRNPGTKIVYEMEEWADWPQLFSIAISSGLGPDLSTGGSYQAMQYYDKGEIEPLDDLVADLERSGEAKDFLPGTLKQMVYKDHTIALPCGIDLRVLFYRKDLFSKAGIDVPHTWHDLRAAAKSLTTPGQWGCVVPGGTLLVMHALFQLLLNNGGGLFNADGKIDMMNDRNEEALRFFSDLVKDGSMNPESEKYSEEDARQAFIEGRGAILFDGMGFQSAYPAEHDKIGLLPPPIGPHGDKGTISWIPNIMVYKQSKNPQAAKAFLRWWSANQKPLWTEGNCSRVPVRASISSDPYFQNDPITKRIIEEWVPVGKSPGSHKDVIFPALNELEGYGPMVALAQDLMNGSDVVASMRTAESRLAKLVENMGSE